MALTAFHFEWPKNLAGESLAPSRELAREMHRRTQALIDLGPGDLYFYGGLLTDVGAEEIDRVLNLLEVTSSPPLRTGLPWGWCGLNQCQISGG